MTQATRSAIAMAMVAFALAVMVVGIYIIAGQYVNDNKSIVVPAENPTHQTGGHAALPGALQASIWQVVAREMGVEDPAIIAMVAGSVEQVIWPDACLGLPTTAAPCGERSVSGWRVWVDIGGEAVEVRTDEHGTQIRINRDSLTS